MQSKGILARLLSRARTKPVKDNPVDLRGEPTEACICGNKIFTLDVVFENKEIVMWFTDSAKCWECGTLLTAPCPSDEVVK